MVRSIKILIVLVFLNPAIKAQDYFNVAKIKLPADIAYYDNQFSSLYIAHDNLYLMSECRIEDNRPAYIAYASLSQLSKAIKDSSYMPDFHGIPLKGLDTIASILKARNQAYEGLEAMAVDNRTYFFSIETNTPSDSCYIIKGDCADSAIQLNTRHFLAIAKPKDENGKAIYNTGYESMEINDGKLYAFFEYNYFKNGNYVIEADLSLDAAGVRRIPIAKIPFRVTDVSWDEKSKSYFGINYFFQGGGRDTVYRVPENDPNHHLAYTDKKWRSYCRIIRIKNENGRFAYTPVASPPIRYWAYNWEGLAKYRKGFFIINDKYTPKKPYTSELLYLENYSTK